MPVVGPTYQHGPPAGTLPGPRHGYPTNYHPDQYGPPPPPMAAVAPPPVQMLRGPYPNGGSGAVPIIPHYPHQSMTMHDQAEAARLAMDYEALVNIIKQWNANRLDLFALTLPNEHLEFHGVMRFYYQSHDMATGQKVATKCIRVSSTATTKLIIETLIEKFRPDMKMLEVPEYALYEIHESGERRLGMDEKPLLVQLNWHKDDREGRFLLRRIDDVTHVVHPGQTTSASVSSNGQKDSVNESKEGEFKRKLSKREKKELKKQEKLNKMKNRENKDESVAEKLYTEFPDTSFTRSISNPEAVMRRRRQQKLEKKLQQFRSKDGGPDTGGTLKIYGDTLCRDVPYKTLLLSVSDSAAFVVEEMLDKYGIDRKEAPFYCLVQATTSQPSNGGPPQAAGDSNTREYYLDDDECPLAILMNHPTSRGFVTFHVRKRPTDLQPRRRKKKAGQLLKDFASESALQMTDEQRQLMPPHLLEMNFDGTDIQPKAQGVMPQRFVLSPNVTEVGSDPAIQSGQSLLLPPAQFLYPRHCVLAYTDGTVTVTPSHRDAETRVNDQRIHETTILQHGCVVRFGYPGHCFRFIDAMQEMRDKQMRQQASSVTLPDHYSMESSHGNYAHFGPLQQPRGAPHSRNNNILPAVLEFSEETEDAFFNAITLSLDVNSVHFKLAPTYTIYMATRFRASIHYRPELIPEERAVRLTDMLNRVAERAFATIEKYSRDAAVLAFWMANASELLHFLKSDRHITSFSHQAQDMLAEAVHVAFKQLIVCLQADLEMTMPNVLVDSDDDDDGEHSTAGTMQILSSAMSLLRKCRVNAALTIQLFSQLFHFVNMWAFNQLVAPAGFGRIPGEKPVNYCTHKWGYRLKRRLSKVENWAEKQGLELAADCHLARVVQAAHLLQARKNTAEDIASLSSICFKLNSLQLKTLLDRYEPAPDEKPISKEMIDTIVRVAESNVDDVTNSEGREVRLEEDYVLQLPFLLPEDGYSCDIVRGVPGGLSDFLAPLQRVGLCVMTPQPTSNGFWTIYMDSAMVPGAGSVTPTPSEVSQMSGAPHPGMANGSGSMPHSEPEVQTIQLVKSNSGMGLSIVAAKGVGKDRLGIYIKAVVEGGAAFHDGRLAAGDQLLRVDGQSLVGITQERAAEIMMHTGQVVELEVAKQGAIYHGLATLLSQPSPVMSPRNRTGGPMVAQSRSMSALHQPPPPQMSPPHEQHTYQNHRTTYPAGGLSQARHHSVQNLDNHQMVHRPTSQVAGLVNGGGRSEVDQGFYQNVGPNGQQQRLLQHMPLRYHQQQQRFGSQSSLQRSHFPPPLSSGDALNQSALDELHHASPRVVGTPMGSGQPHQVRFVTHGPGTPTGPEKPLRQYAHQDEGSNTQKASTTERKASSTRVRFQDAEQQQQQQQPGGDSSLNRVGSRLDQLNLNSNTVEREFRKRIAEYGGVNGTGNDSGSDAEDRRRMPPPPSSHSSHDRLRHQIEIAVEKKERELEEAKKDEDSFLDSIRRKRSQSAQSNTPTPPPLPAAPPPEMMLTATGQNGNGAANRLDMLVGVRGGARDTPTKKVSFMTADDHDDGEESTSFNDEKLNRLERVEKDPNAFISEAESLLNSSSLALERSDSNQKIITHTPSVIGAQEVYKDPRQKRLKKAEEEKASTAKRDGAKLSFQEKMKLFAKEAGENTPNRDKAKISKAQRDLEGSEDTTSN